MTLLRRHSTLLRALRRPWLGPFAAIITSPLRSEGRVRHERILHGLPRPVGLFPVKRKGERPLCKMEQRLRCAAV